MDRPFSITQWRTIIILLIFLSVGMQVLYVKYNYAKDESIVPGQISNMECDEQLKDCILDDEKAFVEAFHAQQNIIQKQAKAISNLQTQVMNYQKELSEYR